MKDWSKDAFSWHLAPTVSNQIYAVYQVPELHGVRSVIARYSILLPSSYENFLFAMSNASKKPPDYMLLKLRYCLVLSSWPTFIRRPSKSLKGVSYRKLFLLANLIRSTEDFKFADNYIHIYKNIYKNIYKTAYCLTRICTSPNAVSILEGEQRRYATRIG